MPDKVDDGFAPPRNTDSVGANIDPFRAREELALQQTLAVPTKPRILELQITADAPIVRSTDSPLPSSRQRDELVNLELTEPLTSGRFTDTYDVQSSRVRELGRGGIGRVILVFDRTLGRDVALKELLPELLEQGSNQPTTEQSLTMRFLREARITGQLEHPNIVPVYELGREPNGNLYYTMRVVRGRTLASAIQGAQALGERLTLVNHFSGFCQAIAYAHSRGVLHRDIKPENVMIGEFGETFVLDWGLAKIVEETSPTSLRAAATLSHPPTRSRTHVGLSKGTSESFQTQMGSIVGTPLYMSPEQILQNDDASKPTADVWSLGVVLHFILTGRLPFSGATLNQLISSILAASPQDISALCPEVPRDLAAIARRALAKNPRDRYPSAKELVRDIVAYQAGEKVAAYEYGSLEILRRFVRRHRAAVAISVAAIVTLVALLFSTYHRVSAARDLALLAEKRATSGELHAKSSLSDVLLERARASIGEGDYATSTLLAAGALELSERPDARGIVIAQSNAERLEPAALQPFPARCNEARWNGGLRQLACRTPTNLYLATGGTQTTVPHLPPLGESRLLSLNAEGWLVRSVDGKSVHVKPDLSWDFLATAPLPSGILAVTEDGTILVHGDDRGSLEIYSTHPMQRIAVRQIGLPVTALSLTASGNRVAIGTYRGEILLWDWRSPHPPTRLGHSRSTVHALAFSPKDNLLLSGGEDRSVLLWDTKQRELSLMPLRATSAVTSLAWSPDGNWFAVGAKTTGIDVIDTQRYERALRVSLTNPNVSELRFASNQQLQGTSSDNSAFLLQLRMASPPVRYAARSNVLSLAWSKAGETLLLAGLGDKGLCHLRLSSGLCTDRLPIRMGLVRRVLLSPDGTRLVLGGTGGSLEIWDAQTNLPVGYVALPIPEVRDLTFLSDHDDLAVVGTVPELVRVSVKDLRVTQSVTLPSAVQSMTRLANGTHLALGLRNGSVALFSTVLSRIENTASLGSAWVMGVVASHKDQSIAAVVEDGSLAVLAIPSLRVKSRVKIHNGRPTAIALSSQLDVIATGGEDRLVQLISASQPYQLIATLDEHQGTVRTLIFDEVRSRLFSAGDDGMVRLWDLQRLRAAPSELRKEVETLYGLHLDSGKIVPTSH